MHTLLFNLLTFFGKIGMAVVPPVGDLDLRTPEGKSMFNWRVQISSTLFLSLILLVGHIIQSAGIIPGTGYALAADTNQVLAELKAQQIYERKKDYCAAPPNSPARQQHWAALEKLRQEYEDLSDGRRYNEPDCSSL